MKQHQPMRLLFFVKLQKKPTHNIQRKQKHLPEWPGGGVKLAAPRQPSLGAAGSAIRSQSNSGKSLQTNGDLNPQMLHGTDIYYPLHFRLNLC